MNTEIVRFEDFFLKYLDEHLPLHGVFGRRDKIYLGKRIKGDVTFMIIDKDFNVAYKAFPPYVKGNYSKTTNNKIEKYNLDKDKTRTDDNVESLLSNLLMSAHLKWLAKYKYDNSEYKDENYKIEMSKSEVEYNSKEFLTFNDTSNLINSYMTYASKSKDDYYKDSDNEIIVAHKEPVRFERRLKEAKEFIEKNTSITPIQDAFFIWLDSINKKHGCVIDCGCELPILKPLNTKTPEELEKEHEEFRKSLSPETKQMLKEIGENILKGNK